MNNNFKLPIDISVYGSHSHFILNEEWIFMHNTERQAAIEFLNKVCCGNGGTTHIINQNINSITILQNKAAVINKAKKHPHILGVYAGITSDDIQNYIDDCNANNKPIIIFITAASYFKIKQLPYFIFGKINFNLYLDECEKMQQGIYRVSYGDIIADTPYYNRCIAFSATPIQSNVHFIINRFIDTNDSKVEIINCYKTIWRRTESKYNRACSNKYTLCGDVDKYFKYYNDNGFVAIFINSVNSIKEIADTIIKEGQHIGLNDILVLCGDNEENILKLNPTKYNRYSDTNVNVNDYKILFITSSGYSSIDVCLDEKRNLKMFAYSTSYGFTRMCVNDIYQCACRFRNHNKGVVKQVYLYGSLNCLPIDYYTTEAENAERAYNGYIKGDKLSPNTIKLMESFMYNKKFYYEHYDLVKTFNEVYTVNCVNTYRCVDDVETFCAYVDNDIEYAIERVLDNIKFVPFKRGLCVASNAKGYYTFEKRDNIGRNELIIQALILGHYERGIELNYYELKTKRRIDRISKIELYCYDLLSFRHLGKDFELFSYKGKAQDKAQGKSWHKPYTKEQLEIWSEMVGVKKSRTPMKYLDEILSIVVPPNYILKCYR